MIAREHLGVPLKIWARVIKKTSPLQAKTEVLLWAVQLAKSENWRNVIFEGAVKICFDAINNPDLPCPWILPIPRCNILALVEWFSSCSFVWVKRSCNGVAHQAARSAVISCLSFFFHKDNLPPALSACCKADYPNCTSFF